ncbi:MAG TPA: hypothetical protein VG323_05725 [Thermoanaerobaculia bacterium]|nr:hypothetical protein [Thermoanaerobaculia bacterium]
MSVTALALTQKRVFAASSSSFVPLMSIGFAPALPADGMSVRLSDAAALLLPDPGFIARGARVSVVGSARAAKYKDGTDGVAVDAAMPAYGSPRYRFWSAAGGGVSGNLGFTVPVPATSGVNLVARRVKQTTKKEELSPTPPADVDPAPFTLSLGGVAGPKLQLGIYVVALRESSNDTFSDWSRFSITSNQRLYSIAGADFDWVMLKIDFAK